jgi:hypothetical protein
MAEKAHEYCVSSFKKLLSFDQNASLGYFSAFAKTPRAQVSPVWPIENKVRKFGKGA